MVTGRPYSEPRLLVIQGHIYLFTYFYLPLPLNNTKYLSIVTYSQINYSRYPYFQANNIETSNTYFIETVCL